jgi:hypothetical protein
MFIWEQQSHFLQVEHLLLRGIRTDKTKKEILRKRKKNHVMQTEDLFVSKQIHNRIVLLLPHPLVHLMNFWRECPIKKPADF